MIMLSLISKKDIAKYALLPGIKTRFSDLFLSGFQHIPFFIALVYQTVKLLPANHPYVNASNIGKFGIRHVIAEAANNLTLKKENIDQLVLFACILVGMGLVFVQICILGISLIWQPALAQNLLFDYFTTPIANRPHDIAGIMMDLVFGVPDIFQSCVSTAAPCLDLNGQQMGTQLETAARAGTTAIDTQGPLSQNAYQNFPFPMHYGLHKMFQVYSSGLLIVAVMISIYFIIAVIAETAQTGTPFGKRYNKVWAPIRIAVAFGLLVPVTNGLNASQYIVLHAAKFGSGFATNGWNTFNNTLSAGFLGDVRNLASQPNMPSVNELVEFFYLARVCYYLEQGYDSSSEIRPYLIKADGLSSDGTGSASTGTNLAARTRQEIIEYAAPNQTTYEDAISFINGANVITIRYGIYDPNEYKDHTGHVAPICGEINIKLSDPRAPGNTSTPPEPAIEALQRYYWYMVNDLWFENALTSGKYMSSPINYPENVVRIHTTWNQDDQLPPPDAVYKAAIEKHYKNDFYFLFNGQAPTDQNPGGIMNWIPPEEPSNIGSGTSVLDLMANSTKWNVPDLLIQRGWGGAGIWYNRIAEMNGAITDSVFNIPTPSKLPAVMELIKSKKHQYNQNTDLIDLYSPELAGGLDIAFKRAEDEQMAKAYFAAHRYWQSDGGMASTHSQLTGNVMVDTINLIIGADGLYSMRKNTDVHPLAQLVGVGKALVSSTVRNIGWTGGGKLLSILSAGKGEGTANLLLGFALTLASISMTIGFILYYILPFLPFIYFFFALGGWVKGIFEAMVGAPLWALAHIRIDGEGLSGSAATNGYLLILEVFLRPILIIFGMIAGISIFSALVSVLNQVFDIVTSNLGGFDAGCEANLTECGPAPSFTQIEFYRGPIDEFFFTVIYALIVYTMGISSFKLIDQIPNNILRWMGQSVSSFNDSTEDPTGRMIGAAQIGAQQGLSGITGGIKSFLK